MLFRNVAAVVVTGLGASGTGAGAGLNITRILVRGQAAAPDMGDLRLLQLGDEFPVQKEKLLF